MVSHGFVLVPSVASITVCTLRPGKLVAIKGPSVQYE